MNRLTCKNAPAAIGPYAVATQANGLIFTSGQLPIDPTSNQLVEADIVLQTKQSMSNIKAILEENGSDLAHVLKANIFIKDMNDFAKLNEAYGKFFEGDAVPARSAVEVARLPKDALVEIEVIAEII